MSSNYGGKSWTNCGPENLKRRTTFLIRITYDGIASTIARTVSGQERLHASGVGRFVRQGSNSNHRSSCRGMMLIQAWQCSQACIPEQSLNFWHRRSSLRIPFAKFNVCRNDSNKTNLFADPICLPLLAMGSACQTSQVKYSFHLLMFDSFLLLPEQRAWPCTSS